MANFKIGDTVTTKDRPYLGTGRIVDELEDGEYVVKFAKGVKDVIEGDLLKLAANAAPKLGKVALNALGKVALNALGKSADSLKNSRSDDPETAKAYRLCEAALRALEQARLTIGGAENDDDAPIEAKEIDNAIGQVKRALRTMA